MTNPVGGEEPPKENQLNRKKSAAEGFLQLIRPANSIMIGFAVIVGIAVTSHQYQQVFTMKALLGFLTGFLLSCFSMISNDLYDINVDRINQPARPLVSGSVSIASAKIAAALFLIAGIAASIPLGPVNFGIASIFAFIAWFYNYRGKKLGLFGNSLVALSLAIPYIYGSAILGNYSINLGYLLALTSFLAGIGREVLKGIADVEGDKAGRAKTVAIIYGIQTAKAVVVAFFILAAASSTLPVALGLLHSALYVYVGLIWIPDAIFLYLAYKAGQLKVESDALKLKSIALGGMMAGLIAYLVAGLW